MLRLQTIHEAFISPDEVNSARLEGFRKADLCVVVISLHQRLRGSSLTDVQPRHRFSASLPCTSILPSRHREFRSVALDFYDLPSSHKHFSRCTAGPPHLDVTCQGRLGLVTSDGHDP